MPSNQLEHIGADIGFLEHAAILPGWAKKLDNLIARVSAAPLRGGRASCAWP